MISAEGAERTRHEARAAIALGSNLGDRSTALNEAVSSLKAHPNIVVERVSEPLSNPAVGGEPGQNDYLNAALILRTTLDPAALLAVMFEIEKQFGRNREREGRNGARTLDLDLLLYDDLLLSEEALSVPHPRMLERDFVLLPLAEIAPEMRHPTANCSIREALQMLEAGQSTAPVLNAVSTLKASPS